MSTGKRDITDEELYWVRVLQKESLHVGSAAWRVRRDLALGLTDTTISMRQAELLRGLVGHLYSEKHKVRAPRFAASDLGQFPYVKKDLRSTEE